LSFCEASEKLLKVVPEIQRLAVGESFLWSAASKQEAYKKLSLQLPGLYLDTEKSSDLFYRINRAREITVGVNTIAVNRVAEWSSPAVIMQVKLNDTDTRTTVAFAAATKTDVNTVPGFDLRKLSDEELRLVSGHLFAFSMELAEKGDVP
jgi:hypothetical protein